MLQLYLHAIRKKQKPRHYKTGKGTKINKTKGIRCEMLNALVISPLLRHFATKTQSYSLALVHLLAAKELWDFPQ